MQSIRDWLADLGLERYAASFEASDVDVSLLPALSEADLEKLGVSLGNRKRILLAAQGIYAEALPAPAAETRGGHPVESLTAEGERRQVTVLFCDLVGSTALSNTLDPEEYRRVLARYHETCIAGVQRFEGFVAQIQGDGIVAYFGYPLAHEGEAERAIRAGLATVEALAALDVGLHEPLQVRIGVASGLVVVSHILSPDKSAVGETPNLAHRLQALAQPGEVAVSEPTRALAAGAFDYQDYGLHDLKGIAGPTRLWRVLGASGATSRFEAATRGKVTPMVGRDAEIELLLERWERSRAGEGQVVLLQGEPGIGKSRMLRAFRERLGAGLELAVQYQCSPYHTNSAFYPIADHLERALRFQRDDTVDAKLDRVEHWIRGELGRTPTDCSLLARVLSLACDARYGKLAMSPQLQKAATIALLVDVLAQLAAACPSVVLFEDAHWADPSTTDVLNALVARAEQLPLLVLITYRPEFQPPWPEYAHVARIVLARLSRTQGASLVVSVTQHKPLPADLVTEIVDRTDGVPLFLEELTKAVLESEMLVEADGQYEYSGTVRDVAIPGTLRDSLMARLDRLIPVKEFAQIGAVLGREFSYELVRAVSLVSEAQLNAALEQLTASGLVFQRGTPPAAIYTFKHALVQDAAYDSLLKSKRQTLHAQIADAIRERFPSICDARPELLAHHYTAAALPEQAVRYWKRAGELAHSRIALQEAIAHLERGLAVAATLPHSQARERHEIELRGLLGMAWIALQGWAYPAVGEHLERAYALEEALSPGQHSLRVLWGLWVYRLALSRTRESLSTAEELLSQGRGKGDEEMLQAGLWAAVTTHYWLGEFDRSIEYAQRILERYDPVRHRGLADALNHDPKTVALQYKSASELHLGYADRATASMQATLEHARHRNHAFDLAWALFFAVYQLHGVQRDAGAIDKLLAELQPLAREQHLLVYEHVLEPFCHAIRALIRNAPAEAAELLHRIIPHLAAARVHVVVAEAKTMAAKCAVLLGEPERALALIDEAMALNAQEGGDTRYHHAEVSRVKGLALEAMSRLADAEAEYQSSIVLARAQQAKWWELRSAVSLARLWQRQGRPQHGYELVAPIYDWFTEGFDTPDLREAAALLADLTPGLAEGRAASMGTAGGG